MLAEQKYLSDLTNQARRGDSNALARLHEKMDPHLERIVRRAMRLDEPRSDLDRQIRAMARHASAMARCQQLQTKQGIVKRVIRGIYDALWNPLPANPPTWTGFLNTVRC